MKETGYIIKTPKYYVTCIVLTAVCLIIALSFGGLWDRTANTLETFDRCSATVIAYDVMPETTNSFANYERNAIVSLTGEDGEAVNAYVYQFLDGVTYSDKSIVNENTVVEGDYKVLEKGEIAVPESIASAYGLKPGDSIFVNGKKCTLKYVFRNVYQVYAVDFSRGQTVVLVGVDTVVGAKIVSHCNFDPDDVVHQRMYNLNSVRKMLRSQKKLIIAVVIAAVTLISAAAALFRRKEEANTFRLCRLAGDNKVFLRILKVELAYILPTAALTFGIGLIAGVPMLLMAFTLCAETAGWAIHTLILSIKIRG